MVYLPVTNKCRVCGGSIGNHRKHERCNRELQRRFAEYNKRREERANSKKAEATC